MQIQLLRRVLQVMVIALLSAACNRISAPEPEAGQPLTAQMTPSARLTSAVTVAPPVTPTPGVDSVPEDWYATIITDTVAAFGTALIQADFATARSYMTDEVLFGRDPTAISGELVPVESALAWLETHWQPGIVVLTPEFVQHYNLVRVDIEGWRMDETASTGKVRFHLHSQLGTGKLPVWTIDAVLTW